MKKQRVIFDLDGTLLTSDPSLERELFEDIYGKEKGDLFVSQIPKVLDVYENRFSTYNIVQLAGYLSGVTGFTVTPEIVKKWVEVLAYVPDTVEDHVIDVLEYLKSKDMSLAVLTNWFRNTQVPRLRKAGLLEYFDQVYTGELFLKPHREAFFGSIGNYDPDQCVFIGDNVNRDYIGPKACGMDSILYDKHNVHHKTLVKVKSLDEIKDRL